MWVRGRTAAAAFWTTRGWLTFSPALKRGDSFSEPKPRATREMRTIAHSRGGRHRPNYQAGARIRPADIDRAHTITMKDERAPRVTAAVQAPRGLIAMPARR